MIRRLPTIEGHAAFFVVVLTVILGVFDPIHAWLHAHVQLILGVFLGSTGELLVILFWERDTRMDVIEERASRPNPL